MLYTFMITSIHALASLESRALSAIIFPGDCFCANPQKTTDGRHSTTFASEEGISTVNSNTRKNQQTWGED